MSGGNSFLTNVSKGAFRSLFGAKRKRKGISFWQEKRLKHLPNDQLHSFNIYGGKFYFTRPYEFMHSFEELITTGIYKFDAGHQRPFIIDCGANIGLSVVYFKHLYPGAEIIAFEPDERNKQTLARNVESFKLADVQLEAKAIWINNDSISFESSGGQGSKIGEAGAKEDTVQISCQRLKDLLDRRIDLLKIDIEGAEYEVMKDCAGSLQNVQHLFVEYHGDIREHHKLTEILTIIEEAGFMYLLQEAANNVPHPFIMEKQAESFDQQLNIFAFRA
ncbi:hypothetical protein COR50_15775 [Chitinophaga caeni]|uniref:Methyltransferase FkbM domain-containing protein n=1 Tax=Chitinophaga caeni TaxID=2029983 RepID=A0A291QX56_9BACT|nr:FkbM family methyltransferase [Chitinophaga caeni]ATL48501.1 hypothetical protein COR50_15775 [Chitinophaga caeni]